MKRDVVGSFAMLLLCIVLLGCEPPRQPTGAAPAPPPPPTAPTTEPSGQAPFPSEARVGVFAGGIDDLAARPSTPPPAQPATPPPAEPATERVKAQAGVGAKGRSLDQHEGLVVTPVKSFFAAKERAFFDIEFPGNYRIWREMADSKPKNFDELKAQFLDPMGLTKKLPVLPPGHKYVWDAEKEELQVERPRPQ